MSNLVEYWKYCFFLTRIRYRVFVKVDNIEIVFKCEEIREFMTVSVIRITARIFVIMVDYIRLTEQPAQCCREYSSDFFSILLELAAGYE